MSVYMVKALICFYDKKKIECQWLKKNMKTIHKKDQYDVTELFSEKKTIYIENWKKEEKHIIDIKCKGNLFLVV